MISLFQTATGSWHIPSILMAASWLIGTLVAGGFMFANLRVNRDDRISAFHAQQQAAKKITQLEEATKPKPLKVRLIAFLDATDKRIIPSLTAGQTVKLSGRFTPAQFADLQRLSAEDGASAFITLHGSSIGVSADGPFNDAEIEVKPSLLKP